jgi:hypothetical protein
MVGGCSLSLGKHLKRQGNWMEETHGTLMVVATVMATMLFKLGSAHLVAFGNKIYTIPRKVSIVVT